MLISKKIVDDLVANPTLYDDGQPTILSGTVTHVRDGDTIIEAIPVSARGRLV